MTEYPFIERYDENFESMIASSLFRSKNEFKLGRLEKLPPVSEQDIRRCQGHVSGHIRLMRKNSSNYYEQQVNILSENRACLCYIHSNFDIFGRFGNKELLKELKEKNFFVGANLSEEVVGTNAAVMATRTQNGVWLIGEDHHAEALKDYACYAFQVKAKYSRTGILMLLTPKENLSTKIVSLFKLLESTESIISIGGVAEDVRIKDVALSSHYNNMHANELVLIVGEDGTITYVNDAFCEAFDMKALQVISADITSFLPGMNPFLKRAMKCTTVYTEKVTLEIGGEAEEYTVTCTPINSTDQFVGCILTMRYRDADEEKKQKCGNTAKYWFDDLIGTSNNFVELKRFGQHIASSSSSVLIQGESGTGKELFAHAIHNASVRRKGPFVAVNCAAIPKDLIESELFGYVGGSFTGANKSGSKGKFELADKGTLFLDEIGEMPIELQSVLLRVLEDHAVTRIGASNSIPVDIRLITATNKDLLKQVREGNFRADLYYRLNVVNLRVMPLRERKQDIPALIDSFLKSTSRKNGSQLCAVSPAAMKAMFEYDWPGNIRELKNVIERGSIIARNGIIELTDLPEEIIDSRWGVSVEAPKDTLRPMEPVPKRAEDLVVLTDVLSAERKNLVKRLLEECHGNKTLVAEKMGISRSTLYRILKE